MAAEVRDLEKDQLRIEQLWEEPYILDPNEIMEIADYAVNRAIEAEKEVDRLYNELRMLQEQGYGRCGG